MSNALEIPRRLQWPAWHFSMPWGRVTCIPDPTGHFPTPVPCVKWGAGDEDRRRMTPDAFLARMEEAQLTGEVEIIDQNMPELDRLIGDYEHRMEELARLLRRAQDVRDAHEPSADHRQM